MKPLPLPCEPHSAIICGQTGCGKTQFVLHELLHPDHGYYRDAFEVVFILCPTWKRTHTYLERLWLWRGPHGREQTKWVALFHCKDRFSFVDVLDENDVVPCELRFALQFAPA